MKLVVLFHNSVDWANMAAFWGAGVAHVYTCACLLGHVFRNVSILVGGFMQDIKVPKFQKWGVFWKECA